MAFRKALAQRLYKISNITSPIFLHNCRTSSQSNTVKSLTSSNPDPGDGGIFIRFLHCRAASKSPGTLFPDVLSFPLNKELLECRGMDIAKDRIRLDVLSPPEKEEVPAVEKLTVENVRKLLILSQLEKVKLKLRQMEKSCISYDELVEVCRTTSFGEDHQCMEMAKMLDQSGIVIVLGNVVFPRPEQVMMAIKCLIPELTPNQSDPKENQQLAEMEKEKDVIDKKAESLVRKELWCGLGYLFIQTIAFIRLTFWELSWDVMEPICFYVTSMYFMAGYTFFLRTSKEPSFEGFFQARFIAKQRNLMKLRNFDIEKYNQLRKACYGDAFRELDCSISFGSKLGDIHDHVVR